jgi:hypothetical protein
MIPFPTPSAPCCNCSNDERGFEASSTGHARRFFRQFSPLNPGVFLKKFKALPFIKKGARDYRLGITKEVNPGTNPIEQGTRHPGTENDWTEPNETESTLPTATRQQSQHPETKASRQQRQRPKNTSPHKAEQKNSKEHLQNEKDQRNQHRCRQLLNRRLELTMVVYTFRVSSSKIWTPARS